MRFDPASLALLARGPAALADRLKPSICERALLTVATIPSYSFGCIAACARLHGHARWGSAVGIAISVCGQGLLVLAARADRRPSTGWPVLLAAVATLSVSGLAALSTHAESVRTPHARERTFEEEPRLARALAERDRRAKAVAERDIPGLKHRFRRCSRELSAASVRSAALTDREHGSLRLLSLAAIEQEWASWNLPGIDAHAYVPAFGDFLVGGRPGVVAISRRRSDAPEVRFAISSPPYGLWRDPWHRCAFMGLNRYASACDAAVESFSTAYNRTMLTLAGGLD